MADLHSQPAEQPALRPRPGPWPLGRGVLLALLAIVAYLVTFPVPCDDHWWHIATGRIVFETFSVPDHDPFSFTFHGAEWVNWEWLTGVALAIFWKLAGPFGLVVLRFLALGGALLVALRARRVRQTPGGELGIVVLVLLCLLVVQARTADRPHTLAFPFLVAADLLALRFRSSRRWGFALVALFLVWVNLHPSFLLGLALVGAQVADELVSAWRTGRLGRRIRDVAPTLGLLALTPLVTPNARRFFAAVHEIFAERVSAEWGSIAEFLGPRHGSLLSFVVLLLVFLPRLWRRPSFETFFVATVGGLALLHVRFTPLFALLALPRASWPLSFSLPARRRRLVTALVLLVGLGGVQSVMRGMGNALGVGVDPVRNPISVADFLEERGLKGRVYCSSKEAHGYLTFRDPEGLQVYIDGRVPQVYPPDFLELYKGTGDPEVLGAEIDRWQIDHVVLVQGIGSPLNRLLAAYLRERGDFDLLYFDENHALWSRPSAWRGRCADCEPFVVLDPWALTGQSQRDLVERYGREPLREELDRLARLAPDAALTEVLEREIGEGLEEGDAKAPSL